MNKIIAQGAEAILIRKAGNLIKRRIKKSYRLQVLDEKLRKSRTKKEIRLLEKASKLIPTPKIINADEKNKEIEMEFIPGLKLSDSLDAQKNSISICEQIGQNLAKIHDIDIIHGDLTTSNMIYLNASNNQIINHNPQTSDNNSASSFKVYFIDFGLGYESSKIEDKAVDLHLIKRALEAKHFNHSKEFFHAILKGYKISKNYSQVLKRLESVEKRGRYKQAY